MRPLQPARRPMSGVGPGSWSRRLQRRPGRVGERWEAVVTPGTRKASQVPLRSTDYPAGQHHD
jgi:hypothetical protein